MNKLFETLRPADLQYLVSDTISVDQYTSKSKSDNITIALNIIDKEAAKELQQLLTKVFIDDLQDIELSSYMTENDEYQLFVEFKRNRQFFNLMEDLIDLLTRLTNIKKWYFKTESGEQLELNKENLISNIRLNNMAFKDIKSATHPDEDKEIKEFLETGRYKRNGNTIIIEDEFDRYDWQIDGFITEEQMNDEIDKAENYGLPCLMTLMDAFPYHQYLEADDKLYLQRDNKILRLKYLG